MNRSTVFQKLKVIIEDELGGIPINENASQESIAEWDSMTYMAIASRVEEDFGLEVTPENIESFNSVVSIIDLVLTEVHP